jgi:hypothetical protein
MFKKAQRQLPRWLRISIATQLPQGHDRFLCELMRDDGASRRLWPVGERGPLDDARDR